jgi:4-hydroxybenzoate polyprenyltransferase
MSVHGIGQGMIGPHGRLSARQAIAAALLLAVCAIALAAGVLAPTGQAGGAGSAILVAYRSGTNLLVKSAL